MTGTLILDRPPAQARDALSGNASAPTYKLVARPSSKRLLILFSGSGVGPHVFHWWNVGQEADANVLYVNNGVNQWYHYGVPGLGTTLEETIATIRAWGDANGIEDYLTIGGSMGGHGAVLFGVALDARILAFGFETRIMLEGSRSLKLTAPGFTPPFTDLGPLMAASRRKIIAYIGESDPIDLYTADGVKDLDTLELVTLKKVGHGPPAHMRNRDRLQPVIDAFMEDRPQPEQPDAGDALLTPGFAKAQYDAHCGYWARDPRRCEQAARRAIGLRASSEYPRYLLGCAHFQSGSFELAVPQLLLALKLRPNFWEAQLQLARSLRHCGRNGEAIAAYSRMLSQKPDSAEAHFEQGLSQYNLGNIKEAISSIRNSVQIKPNNKIYLRKLKTLSAQWKSLSADQKLSYGHYALGRKFLVAGDVSAALSCFTKSNERWPDFKHARYFQASCTRISGNPRKAIVLHKQNIARWRDFAPSYLDAGIAHAAIGEMGKAISFCAKALEKNPRNLTARDWLRRINRRIAQTNRKARKACHDGRRLLEQKRLAEAIDLFEKSCALKPDYGLPRFLKGNALRRSGDAEGAVACHLETLARFPDYAAVHFDLGLAQVARGDLLYARKSFNDALRLNSGYSDAVSGVYRRRAAARRDARAAVRVAYTEAREACAKRHFAKARHRLEGVIAQRPRFRSARLLHAKMLSRLGRHDDAASQYLTMVERWPRFYAACVSLMLADARALRFDRSKKAITSVLTARKLRAE